LEFWNFPERTMSENKDLINREATTVSLLSNKPAVHPADRKLEAMLKGKAAHAKRAPGPTRMIISLDATSSMGEFLPDRKLDLEAFRSIVRPMFEKAGAAGLEVQLMYFRGDDRFGNRECRVSKWFRDPEELTRAMARIKPAAGWTQHNRVLERTIREAEKHPIQELVVISDAFEERGPCRPDGDILDDARVHAAQLRALGVKITVAYRGTIVGGCPLDRAGPHAEEAFRSIVRENDGSLFLLDPAKPARVVEHIALVAAHAELVAKGDAAGAQLLLQHIVRVPFTMDPVGEQVPHAECNERYSVAPN
jgi:hypothetical protein